jgi:hypothetical protein
MFTTTVRRILIGSIASVPLTVCAFSQSYLEFPPPTSTDFQNYAAQNVGVSPVVFLGKVLALYQSTYTYELNQVCIIGYYGINGGTAVCPVTTNSNFPTVDGVAQGTVWNGRLYIAFARRSDHQLVIASSSDAINWTLVLPAGIYVGVSPAIAVLNNTLYIAYQENQQDHYLGMAESSDGVNWTNQLSSVYKIGHAPGMTYFNGQLVIAAFCQCDSHYLDIYTTTGSLSPIFATEDRSKTLSNASQPSLAVYNNVLLLGYMQNGQRYFMTSTSYDAINWTTAFREIELTNGWNGLGLAVLNSQIYGIYESQSAIPGDPNSGPNEFAYSISGGVQ